MVKARKKKSGIFKTEKKRKGAVRGRTQALNPKTGKWVRVKPLKFSTPIMKIYWDMKMDDLKKYGHFSVKEE